MVGRATYDTEICEFPIQKKLTVKTRYQNDIEVYVK